ncbi:hypothetical protein V1478_017138 [Vespula squamosa]|uniref:Uncharacterized protein n=1 Tax=Vespula squamosa TaxID=30214 RepID=A0ABD2A0Y4_VESSQ
MWKLDRVKREQTNYYDDDNDDDDDDDKDDVDSCSADKDEFIYNDRLYIMREYWNQYLGTIHITQDWMIKKKALNEVAKPDISYKILWKRKYISVLYHTVSYNNKACGY